MKRPPPPAIAWHPLPRPWRATNHCGVCACKSPRLFHVPDDVWVHYVGEEQRGQLLCIRCWDQLTDFVDDSAFEDEHGGPVPLWSDAWRQRKGIDPSEPCPMSAEQLRLFTIAPRR